MLFEPAFPDTRRPGMCLRDYIAIRAMTAMLQSNLKASPDYDALAADAYMAADAMLRVREPAALDVR